MKNTIYLDKNKRKYKGNLHTHTTRSDGFYSPEEVIKLYKDKNYNFLCFTDHETYFNSDEFNCENFILLSGYEMACYMEDANFGNEFHINGFLDESIKSNFRLEHNEKLERPTVKGLSEMQGLINSLHLQGNLVVLNHPFWSKNRAEDLLKLKGPVALEIYNNHHQVERNEELGYSVDYWDYLLRNGLKIYGVANDDAHVINEFFGGWIFVQAPSLDSQAIIDSIKVGSFYSTTGPEIFDLRVVDDIILVSSSNVKTIKFITCSGESKIVSSQDGYPINSASYEIQGSEKYVRLECIDFKGKRSWSNPIFI